MSKDILFYYFNLLWLDPKKQKSRLPTGLTKNPPLRAKQKITCGENANAKFAIAQTDFVFMPCTMDFLNAACRRPFGLHMITRYG
jgi:hypothetical protein